MTSIVVLEDHEIVVEGLIQVLRDNEEFSIDYHAKTLTEFLGIAEKRSFDMAIVDINVQDQNSLDYLEGLIKGNPQIKVIIFSMYSHTSLVKKAKAVGVHGYLHKTIAADELLSALYAIKNERFYLSSNITEKLITDNFNEFDEFSAKNKLSTREYQIAKMYANLEETQDISEKLSISAFTLKQHRRNIYKKLGINSIAQLVKFFKD